MKYLLIIVFVILGLFFLSTNRTSNEIISPISREDEYKVNFTAACVKASGMVDTCNCLYTYVSTNYDWEERMELDRAVERGENPQAINDALLYCAQ